MMIVALIVGALLVPLFLYAYASSPLAWGMIRDGKIRFRGGAYRSYREAPQIRWVEGRAPAVVRVAAFTSFCLGQMLIPGIPGALLLILITFGTWIEGCPAPVLIVLSLSAPTGLLVAARVLGAGLGLLQRAPHAADRARTAARWELCHNVALSVFIAVLLGIGVDETEARWCCGVTLVLAVAACLHAGLLFTAADALDAYNEEAEATEPASIPT
jgi:hypothetical protein